MKFSKLILFLLLLGLAACSDSSMQEGAEWLNEPEVEAAHYEQRTNIPASDIYEVTASKADLALKELEPVDFLPLSPERAMSYTGQSYDNPAGKQAYLVRAVYGHAGTGAYKLKQLDHDLLIQHESLGHSTIYQKSALVVNLDYDLEQLFIRVKIAE